MKEFLRKEKNVVIITIIILMLLSILKKVYVFEFKYNGESNVKITGMIIQKEKETEDRVSYIVKYDSNKFLLNIYKYDVKDTRYKYGDVIEFRGNINKIEKLNNPYEFDYKKYLNSNNIVTTITATGDIKYISRVNGNILLKICYILKECVSYRVEEKIPKLEANLYKSMIYGDDLYLDEDIKNDFKANGMSHLLAVSGLHLMYLILILDIVFKRDNIRNFKIIYYVIIICYIIISGMSMSSIRAGIMSILLIYEKKNNDNIDNLKRKYIHIAISYIIILLYNPYAIFNVSGILSYLATIGILTFNSLIYSFFEIILKVSKYTLLLFKILSPTFASLIMVFPVQIYYFGCIELRLLFSCVITNFLISFIYLVGFVTLFLSFVPFISDVLFNSLYFLLYILIKLSNGISNISIPTLTLPKQSIVELWIYYISIGLLVVKKYLPLVSKRDLRIILKKCISVFVIITFCILIFLCMYRIYFEEYVIYFNVGQGNMSIIKKDGKVIVIDAGATQENLASNILNNFLLAKAEDEIDLLLITHMHTDHMNAIYGIDAKIKKVGYSIPKEKTEEYFKFEKFLDENNISKMELKKDDKITFKNISIDILLPYNDRVIESNDVLNSNSIVALVNLKENKKNIKLLYMGDATIETEKELLNNIHVNEDDKLKDISVLQIGHHGSKTSTSEEFLSYLNINLAVISSKKKVYGHPAKETLDKLNKYNIRYKITEKDGAVIIKM